MKKTKYIKYAETLILIAIWVAVVTAPVLLISSNAMGRWSRITSAWMMMLPFFLLFAANHFLLVPLFLFKKRKWIYMLAASLLVLAFNFFLFVNHNMKVKNNEFERLHPARPLPHQLRQSNLMGEKLPPANPMEYPPILSNFILSLLIIGFDTGLRMIVRYSEIEKDKMILEKENMENQLAFLRNQISPHFFMNTLNNIHSLMDVDVEEAKESVIKLSKLMRHLLYDSELEKTPLKKEIEFVKSYVNLMKLRFSVQVKIDLNVPDEIPETSIPPLLFTSLMENAFKHGIRYNENSFITISFSFKDGKLIFETINSNHPQKEDKPVSGIGLENTRKRLDLLYKDKYTFTIDENEKTFTTKLILPL